MNSNRIWCLEQRSTSVVKAVSVLLLLVGCGSRVDVESAPTVNAAGETASEDQKRVGSGGAPGAGDAFHASGGVPIRADEADSAAGREDGGTTGCSNPDWNSSKFDYGGSISFVPGVECTCDACGDSTCTGSLATVCGRITGCRATFEAAKSAVDVICESHPAYALYSAEGEQNVIYYGAYGGVYRMGFDQETGVLVAASSSAQNGLACYLSGKTELAAGLELGNPTPTCRLCAADTTDPTFATVPECPDGVIP
jgi:hypothetical protein